jgi:hypothetical protein
LLWFWSSLGVRCVVSLRVRAAVNPARYASNGCHFFWEIKRPQSHFAAGSEFGL